MIEFLKKENIKGIDLNKVKSADFLIIEDKLLIDYQKITQLSNDLIKQLEKEGYIILANGGKFNFNDIVKANVEKELMKIVSGNEGLEPDDLLYVDPN